MRRQAVDTSAIVLAGGEGRRMGGGKALARFRGRPLVAWALDAVAFAEEALVACGPGPADALRAAVEGRAVLVPDEGAGPASGLAAAARVARGDWLLVAPCDAPLLSDPLYRLLLDRAREGHGDGAAVGDAAGVQPLVAACRRAPLLAALEAAGPAAGVRGALARLRLRRVPPADLARVPYGAHAVRDADTPDALAELESLARAHDASGGA